MIFIILIKKLAWELLLLLCCWLKKKSVKLWF